MMLILVFAGQLTWLPSRIRLRRDTLQPGSPGAFIGRAAVRRCCPRSRILITSIGGWVLTMRNTMVTTLAEDYVRMARAKGLPGCRIMLDYAARNAILPNLTGFAMSLGFVVSGAILVEYAFNYPGVGFMLLQAVNNEDYPLMQALFLLITGGRAGAILLADIATALFDPRTRTGGSRWPRRQPHRARPGRVACRDRPPGAAARPGGARAGPTLRAVRPAARPRRAP